MSSSRATSPEPDTAVHRPAAPGTGRPERTEQRTGGPGPPGPATGLYLYGVVRSRSWRGTQSGTGEEELVKVRYRDLEALGRTAPFELPSMDDTSLSAHQRVVEGVMRRGTILPAPYGLVFRGRRPLVRFLEDQYIVLDEGLAFLEGHWELRLHITAAEPGEASPEASDVAMHIYSELRRFARAAIPLPGGERVLSAAFLVERTGWIQFVERSDDLGTVNPDLALDVTGPWPPYDFVKMTV